jgi:large subunit ribosomal protein L24e
MPITRPCSFCGNEIEPGTASMHVRRDGVVRYFCSSKCRNNALRMGRQPRDVKWTLTYAAAKGKVTAPTAVGVVEATGGPEVKKDYTLHLPKGKAIPPALVDLVHKQLGRELALADVEKRFVTFSQTPALRTAVAQWFTKRNPKKALAEVTIEEYKVFLDTAGAKKQFKDWLEAEAKKEKA